MGLVGMEDYEWGLLQKIIKFAVKIHVMAYILLAIDVYWVNSVLVYQSLPSPSCPINLYLRLKSVLKDMLFSISYFVGFGLGHILPKL